MNQYQSRNIICKHLKFINKQTIKRVTSSQVIKNCVKHSLPLYYFCLHCGSPLCLKFQQQISCLQMHRNINNSHYFAFQMHQGSIWCSECEDTIQNLIFCYEGDQKNEDFLRMNKFYAYLLEVWQQLTCKFQIKITSISHRGIQNLGNTCYLNSVLQCLFASVQLKRLYQQIETFKENFVEQKIRINKKVLTKDIQYFYDEILQKNENEKWTIVKSKKERSLVGENNKRHYVASIKTAKFNILFKQFLKQMLDEKEKPFVPNKILNFLTQINAKYQSKEQQDADELLLLIIDILSEGQRINLLKDIDRYKSIEAILGNQKLTPVQSIFGFYLLNETQCNQCKQINTSLNLTYNISLSLDAPLKQQYKIIHESNKIKMDYWEELEYPEPPQEQCLLSSFFNVQRLNKHSNYYECVKCKSIVAYRKYLIISPPQILIVTLKRFNAQLQKKQKYISFPEKLDLRGIASAKEVREYNLYGVIVHEGRSISNGHYLSFIKIDNQWFLCSDNKVQTVTWNQVRSQQAYILFYNQSYDL